MVDRRLITKLKCRAFLGATDAICDDGAVRAAAATRLAMNNLDTKDAFAPHGPKQAVGAVRGARPPWQQKSFMPLSSTPH